MAKFKPNPGQPVNVVLNGVLLSTKSPNGAIMHLANNNRRRFTGKGSQSRKGQAGGYSPRRPSESNDLNAGVANGSDTFTELDDLIMALDATFDALPAL